MNSVEKETVLHCLKSMIDEEVCEECPLYGTTGTDHCEKDCVRLAINALEQEPCTDAISRQAAIDALDCINGVEEVLKSLPPVTPAEKVGHWIDEGFYAEGHSEHAYRCSKCNEHYIGYVGEYKYCPNCGAKMGGTQHERP